MVLVSLAVASHANASPLFENDTVLSINLAGPISSLKDNKENRTELPFTIRANDIEHQVKVRVRGKSRIRLCDFPPLRINFSGEETTQTVFAGQDKLKLVTHCKHKASAQSDILEEYAAYKIFNLISDVSYKVRLVRITYRDTDEKGDEEDLTRYGFFVESATELAGRVGGERIHIAGVTLGSLDAPQAASVFVFQYLIGNTDWSLVAAEGDDSCCHNGHLFEIQSRRFIVPYDFDLSGLVNAKYARPDPGLRISKVTQRLYRGYCIQPGALADAIETIADKKRDILAVASQVTGLPEKNIEKTEKYLDKFFVKANDAGKLERSFERKCL